MNFMNTKHDHFHAAWCHVVALSMGKMLVALPLHALLCMRCRKLVSEGFFFVIVYDYDK
jgi:hypothetical protein